MYGGSAARAWMASGVCVAVDGAEDLFFAESAHRQADAKAVCAGCPVRAECLEWAMTQEPGMPGVWGGTTKRERRAMRAAEREVAA